MIVSEYRVYQRNPEGDIRSPSTLQVHQRPTARRRASACASPRYLGLRDDKDPSEVVRERPAA